MLADRDALKEIVWPHYAREFRVIARLIAVWLSCVCAAAWGLRTWTQTARAKTDGRNRLSAFNAAIGGGDAEM